MRRTLDFIKTKLYLAMAIFAVMSINAHAEPLSLRTNQRLIEELIARSNVDITNANAVFEAVFEALPPKVMVYPTESYFYFTFPHNGISYEGNIRFDAADQFDGKVHFAYFAEYAAWREPKDPVYRKLGPGDGVDTKKLSTFSYTITFKGKTVTFDLPDLSAEKPPQGAVRDGEIYLGPIWDESGLKFFLLYNAPAKTFLYLLNEATPMDVLEQTSIDPAVTLGNRTGFAFYKDAKANRQILIGSYGPNYDLNTYYDGPFDQIGDNYIQGNALLDILVGLDPSLKGNVDRYGSSPTGEVRYDIRPYVLYTTPDDLKPVAECVSKAADDSAYYTCFNAQK